MEKTTEKERARMAVIIPAQTIRAFAEISTAIISKSHKTPPFGAFKTERNLSHKRPFLRQKLKAG